MPHLAKPVMSPQSEPHWWHPPTEHRTTITSQTQHHQLNSEVVVWRDSINIMEWWPNLLMTTFELLLRLTVRIHGWKT